ncbi:MAG: hypothetical protein PHR30_14850 [Gallionellaceae bacterium]|nr:hypothetical protein [Gallionellaceae bacterium]
MNRIHIFLGSAALALAAAPALAVNLDGNADLDQSILNDHGNTGYVGTSFSSGRMERGHGDLYGSILLDVRAGNNTGGAGMTSDQGDAIGSFRNDLGR